jgi:hypothetical protein
MNVRSRRSRPPGVNEDVVVVVVVCSQLLTELRALDATLPGPA